MSNDVSDVIPQINRRFIRSSRNSIQLSSPQLISREFIGCKFLADSKRCVKASDPIVFPEIHISSSSHHIKRLVQAANSQYARIVRQPHGTEGTGAEHSVERLVCCHVIGFVVSHSDLTHSPLRSVVQKGRSGKDLWTKMQDTINKEIARRIQSVQVARCDFVLHCPRNEGRIDIARGLIQDAQRSTVLRDEEHVSIHRMNAADIRCCLSVIGPRAVSISTIQRTVQPQPEELSISPGCNRLRVLCNDYSVDVCISVVPEVDVAGIVETDEILPSSSRCIQ